MPESQIAMMDAWRNTSSSPKAFASEASFLALVDEFFASRSEHLPLGRGHDCAVLSGADPLVLSTDLFLERVHFSRRYFTPEEVGAKALAAAVSDLAAAGAVPLAFSLGLVLPPDMGAHALRALFSGMAAQAGAVGMALSGGDLSKGDTLALSVTVWGAPCAHGAPFLRRATARPGDVVFLAGDVGLARVGLQMFEEQGRIALEKWPAACQAHLRVRPLLAEGQALAQLALEEELAARKQGRPAPEFSLMDVSDGLAADLPRLLGGLGADVRLEPGCIADEVRRAALLMQESPEDIFLQGGEDYALLGTCPEHLWPLVQGRIFSARLLGMVREQSGLCVNGKERTLHGFDHFCAYGKAARLEKTAPASAPASAHEQPALPIFARQAANELVRIGRKAWQAGLMAGFNGNISCRISANDGREFCLVTRSGAAKARLTHADLCLVDMADGSLVFGPPPSTESAVHLGIYRACSHSRAVLHVHPPKLLGLCLRFAPQERLSLPLPEAATYSAKLAWTPFFLPGSAGLGNAVSAAAKDFPAVWMERHGLVTHGPDLSFALSLAEELEQLASVQLYAG